MLVKDDTFKLIPVNKPFCKVCNRNTFHLAGNCTEHSNRYDDQGNLIRHKSYKGARIPYGPQDDLKVSIPVKQSLSTSQRRDKFNNTIGSDHHWSVIESKGDPKDQSKPRCLSCGILIEIVAAVFGKVAIKLMRKQIDFERVIPDLPQVEGKVFPARKYVRLPEYQKGYVCRSCYEDLYNDFYVNDKGEKVRSIIPLDHPDNTIRTRDKVGRRVVERSIPVSIIKERQTRDDSFPSGKQPIKSVTTVILDHGIPTDEEWRAPRPPKPAPEPISRQGMNYAYRGSSHPEHCSCARCRHRDRR